MSNPTEANAVTASIRMISVKNKGGEGLLVATRFSIYLIKQLWKPGRYFSTFPPQHDLSSTGKLASKDSSNKHLV